MFVIVREKMSVTLFGDATYEPIIGGAAVYAMYSKAYTPKKVCMLGYPLAYTKIGATIKT